MKSRCLPALMLIALIGGLGCEENLFHRTPLKNEMGEPPLWPPPGPEVPALVAGVYGSYPAYVDERVFVSDSDSWSFLYRWVTGDGSSEPAIDFANKEVVAGLLLYERESSGYGVRFSDVGDGHLMALATSPAPGDPVNAVMTRPFGFLNLTSTYGEVFFQQGDAFLAGTKRTYPDLVQQDYPLHQAFPAADPADLDSLKSGLCPVDGTALVTSPLYDAIIPNQADNAFYCPEHGAYWTSHWSSFEPFGDPTWEGPFRPGFYD